MLKLIKLLVKVNIIDGNKKEYICKTLIQCQSERERKILCNTYQCEKRGELSIRAIMNALGFNFKI